MMGPQMMRPRMWRPRLWRRGYLMIAGALLLGGCSGDPTLEPFDGDLSGDGERGFYNQVRLYGVGPGAELSPGALESKLVDLAESSTISLDVAFRALESEDIARALIRARDRGVFVRVVADIDAVDASQLGFDVLLDNGFDLLEAVPTDLVNEDPERSRADSAIRSRGGFISAGNGALSWSPQPSITVDRLGDHNRMTDSYMIVDRLRMLTLSGGVPDNFTDLSQTAMAISSQRIAIDYSEAFDQMAGGVFATTLTVFGASIPSDSNNRTLYPTEDGWSGLWFGPQEPNMKQIVDELYAAKSSIDVVSSELDSEFVAKALRYKAAAGFRVRVLLPENPPPPSRANQDWVRYLEDAFRGRDNAELRKRGQVGGTMVIIDGGASPFSGEPTTGQAMVLSMAILPAIPFSLLGPDRAASYPVDPFSNSNMMSVFAGPEGSSDFDAAKNHFERLYQ